jgi:hypothetical protein
MLFRSVLRTEATLPDVLMGLQKICMTDHEQWSALSQMLKDFNA